MANIKSLVKDTAVYGMSSIIGRFLNYLLVPLYTHVISAASGGYGVVTNLYAYVALMLVILTFGMETTFFRFANKEDENPHCVFSTSIFMVSALSALFLVLTFGLIGPISEALGYVEHKEYILMLAVVVALDAFQAIPFSYLRYKKKAIKFASLKLLFILMNIGLNLVSSFGWARRMCSMSSHSISYVQVSSPSSSYLSSLTSMWQRECIARRKVLSSRL